MVALLENPEKTMQDIAPTLLALAQADVEFPTTMRRKLLGRRLRDMLSSFDTMGCNAWTSEFAETLNPFPGDKTIASAAGSCPTDAADEGSGSAPFDPLKPTLAALDCSLSSRLQLASMVLGHDVLYKLVDEGEAMTCIAKALATQVVQMLEEAIESIEVVPDELEHILIACRSLSTLLDPSSYNPDYSAVAEIHAAGCRSAEGLLGDLAVKIKGAPFYNSLLEEFLAKAPESKLHLPSLQAAARQVEQAPMTCCAAAMDSVSSALELIGKVGPLLRRGAVGHASLLCRQHLDAALADCKSKGPPDELAEAIQILLPPLSMASEMLADAEALVAGCGWCTKMQTALSRQGQAKHIAQQAEATILEGGEVDDAAVHTLKRMLGDAGCEIMNDKDCADRIALVVNTWMDWSSSRIADSGLIAETCRVLLPLIVAKAGCANLLAEGRALEAGIQIRIALEGFKNIDPDMSERILKDTNQHALKHLMRAHGALMEIVNDSSTTLRERISLECSKLLVPAAAEIDLAAEKIISDRKAAMTTYLQKVQPWCRGGADGKAWSDSLADDASIDEVLELAQATLLKHKPTAFDEAEKKLASKRDDYANSVNMFLFSYDDSDVQAARDVGQQLKLSYNEGMLVRLLLSDMRSKDRKIKVHAVAKSMPDPGRPWEGLHPALQARASEAMRMR